MQQVDILFVAWNRLEFTLESLSQLILNTDWSLVERLCVYDDGSTDGTYEALQEQLATNMANGMIPVPVTLEQGRGSGPVGIMNAYVEHHDSEYFAKIDNDIIVPPGWLNRLVGVMDGTTLDALGMEAGRMGEVENEQGWEHARWIGGVGLIRTGALGNRPQMVPRGEGNRYGWTEFQQEYSLECGWVCPDILCFSLDQVPLEPMMTWNAEYHAQGWTRERQLSRYHERWMSRYWRWWRDDSDLPSDDDRGWTEAADEVAG